MSSFITKKKKYKFQVEICLEELLEVPFVSAVLFAKLRLLDGGNFQDHSSRQEVKDHKVHWGASFSFPCKMMANASTGVMERCALRISIRKESKGGRSFNKLGFVDLNLAEYAGAGLTRKKALLEGYDTRLRQDNSMLKFRIQLNMISGDILFKAPSPTLKHKQMTEESAAEPRSEEFSGGSLAGSIASGSSGFGSLPKKRPALLSSDLVIGQTLTESHAHSNDPTSYEMTTTTTTTTSDRCEVPPDSNCETGHSRNSSNTSQLSKASGYSGSVHSHSRQSSSGDSGHIRNHQRSAFARPSKRINIPTTILSQTPPIRPSALSSGASSPDEAGMEVFSTPLAYFRQTSGGSSAEEFKTPECTLRTDVFSNTFNDLQKSASSGVVGQTEAGSGVVRSRSEFVIPQCQSPFPKQSSFANRFFLKSDSLFSFLTPRPTRRRRPQHISDKECECNNSSKCCFSSFSKLPKNHLTDIRATSLSSLRSASERGAVERNPSSGSLVVSETGSLDRARAAYERRKKINQSQEDNVPGRVEITRVNPDDLIEELLKSTNLEQADDAAETSGLQLFIAKDGTAALGSHEVKSQISTGVQSFKQVVMDNR